VPLSTTPQQGKKNQRGFPDHPEQTLYNLDLYRTHLDLLYRYDTIAGCNIYLHNARVHVVRQFNLY
jgi:hypothetical protein